MLGETREEIAAEKLAVARPGATVVLPDAEFAALVEGREVRIGDARAAAEAFLGRPVDELAEAVLPGRLELRGDEVWDGAHTPAAVDWLLERLPEPGDYVAGRILVATRSSNARSLDPGEVAARARTWFSTVEIADDPLDALRLARAFGRRVLVTGSLYLLADLTSDE